MSAQPLLPLERAALELLLAGDHPMLGALRKQLDDCRASERRFDGVGFFTKLVHPPGSTPIPATLHRVVLSDVSADWDGLVHGASLIVFVDDGQLALLEGFTLAGEPWPEHAPNWRVSPQPSTRGEGVRTNLEQLDAAWPWSKSRVTGT